MGLSGRCATLGEMFTSHSCGGENLFFRSVTTNYITTHRGRETRFIRYLRLYHLDDLILGYRITFPNAYGHEYLNVTASASFSPFPLRHRATVLCAATQNTLWTLPSIANTGANGEICGQQCSVLQLRAFGSEPCGQQSRGLRRSGQ